jgi:hypothetical protein
LFNASFRPRQAGALVERRLLDYRLAMRLRNFAILPLILVRTTDPDQPSLWW